MFDNICSLPLTSDLFAQAVHPTEPLVAVGQLTGHVATLRLPPAGTRAGTIATAWRTKRHAGSCRGLGFSADGRTLFSAGADGVVKAAETGTGVVRSKVVLPMVDRYVLFFPFPSLPISHVNYSVWTGWVRDSRC